MFSATLTLAFLTPSLKPTVSHTSGLFITMPMLHQLCDAKIGAVGYRERNRSKPMSSSTFFKVSLIPNALSVSFA